MPIRHYLQGHRFEAEMVRLLGIAYEMALVALHQNLSTSSAQVREHRGARVVLRFRREYAVRVPSQ